MTFVSSTFLFFILAFALAWWCSPRPWRWLTLLLASYVFYIWHEPIYGILLLTSTAVDFWAARQMHRHQERSKRRPYLYLSLLTNIGLLAGFKYATFLSTLFFGDIMTFQPLSADSDLLIPIGISFYTFQTLSYTIDVYRNDATPETHFGKFAVFVSFFPQLIAGPIERFSDLMPQIHAIAQRSATSVQVSEGVRLLIWGTYKKIVVADRMGVIVDSIFAAPEGYSGVTLLGGGTLFMIQLYADFSGYTDIARGLARLMGINLSLNWKYPLFATSMREYWSTWHITLNQWFRDYVYIPLGGNRLGYSRTLVNIMIVTLISGLWHGANLTFLIWGALNGLYLVVERMLRKAGFPKAPAPIAWGWLIIVNSLIFVVFRAPSMEAVMHYFEVMGEQAFELNLRADFVQLGLWHWSVIATFAAALFMLTREFVLYRASKGEGLHTPQWRWAIIALLTLVVGEFQNETFIYFMF